VEKGKPDCIISFLKQGLDKFGKNPILQTKETRKVMNCDKGGETYINQTKGEKLRKTPCAETNLSRRNQ
jgi:hypothetical protein